MTNADKKIILSGIQPTGDMNLGNYLGALRQWGKVQDDYRCFFCIVDLHALTVRQEPNELRRRCRELAAVFMACGIDPEKSTIFIQSHVPQHSQLAWLLSTFTMMGELEKMTQFKDKANRHKQNVNAGLFSYPVLMAADILLYQAGLVPVGADQKQHLELARNIAVRFNNWIDREIFKVPDAYIPPTGARIMDLQHPEDKMSKSMPPSGTLPLLEDIKKLNKKIRRAVTDNEANVKFDPEKQPGVSNLLGILSAIRGGTPEERASDFEGMGYRELKEAVAEAVIETVTPIQERYTEIVEDKGRLDAILASGAQKAREVAQQTLDQAHDALGLVPPLG
jgi:tryptophanyl-tRNA synthetase